MKHSVFGKEIETEDFYCQRNHCNDLSHVSDPYINMYIKTTEVCQARCMFCEFCTNQKEQFELHKLYYILSELGKKVRINKISFTGGEPTLFIDEFKQIIGMTREACPDSFIVVNTNGYNVVPLLDMPEIDNFSISHHHYMPHANHYLFGTDKVPTIGQLSNLPHKEKIHLSCNLVKGYIDSRESIIEYLEHAADMGYEDVGFVTLMKVNEFCNERSVDFRDINLTEGGKIMKYATWTNPGICECQNYVYLASNGKAVRIYARYNYDITRGRQSCYVFDGKNLRKGFVGEVII